MSQETCPAPSALKPYETWPFHESIIQLFQALGEGDLSHTSEPTQGLRVLLKLVTVTKIPKNFDGIRAAMINAVHKASESSTVINTLFADAVAHLTREEIASEIAAKDQALAEYEQALAQEKATWQKKNDELAARAKELNEYSDRLKNEKRALEFQRILQDRRKVEFDQLEASLNRRTGCAKKNAKKKP